ncbi:MAG: cbb3-type cytochrome c oxidase subunit 3 [Pseudomonadota bacterium]
MNAINFITDIRSIMTVVSLLVFLGIVFWSYSSGRKEDFDAAARLPFADEAADTDMQQRVRESQHG